MKNIKQKTNPYEIFTETVITRYISKNQFETYSHIHTNTKSIIEKRTNKRTKKYCIQSGSSGDKGKS